MLIEIRREIILSPRGEDTRVYMRVLEKRRFSTACQVVLMTSKNASNEQKEAAKRVTRMGCTVVEERRRTRKDRLSRSSKREGGGRRKRKKEKRGGGKKNKGKKKAVLRSPHEDLPTQDHDKITLQNPPCERIILPLCTGTRAI